MTYKLNNGKEIPNIGFGTFKAQGNDCEKSVIEAIKAGYRLIDTAFAYDNHLEVGKGIKEGLKETNLKREDLFITTKLWSNQRKYNDVIAATKQALFELGLDYLDLLLIHWPNPLPYRKTENSYIEINNETYSAMEKLYKEGVVRAIGVSNFMIKHLQNLTYNIKPMVDQVLRTPGQAKMELYNYLKNENIMMEAYTPLGKPPLLNDIRILKLANKYNCTAAQILLAYQINCQVIPLVKSVHKERLISNLASTKIVLTKEDIEYLNNLKLDTPIQTEYEIDHHEF